MRHVPVVYVGLSQHMLELGLDPSLETMQQDLSRLDHTDVFSAATPADIIEEFSPHSEIRHIVECGMVIRGGKLTIQDFENGNSFKLPLRSFVAFCHDDRTHDE